MDQGLFKFIWQHSAKQQIRIVLLTCLSFPLLYFSLEIPKTIINEALSGDFRRHQVLGFELTPVQFLVGLCLLLLTLIVFNGLLKMRINTLKGIIGERLIRRLRYQLIQRILRFPTAHLAGSSQGEFISSITGEAEPIAGYISESIALPLFQGGTMITILVFMFVQDWVFGLASVALIPVQGYVIPKLQAQVNALKKQRILRVRKLSERIGETISGASEIRLQGTERYALAEFSHWLGGLFDVRLQIFRKKFFMKFLNNTIGQITPFLFYLLGGILVIKGDLTIGALVAALAAYKDLTSPWRELLNHYQIHEDAKIKYVQILEQFSPRGLIEPVTDAGDSDDGSLLRPITLDGVSWQSETGEFTINDLSLRIAPGEQVAIIGENAVQRMRLAGLLNGLEQPSDGEIRIGDAALDKVDHHLLRTRMAFQGPEPHFFDGTIQDNIVYGLNHRPPESDRSESPGTGFSKEAAAAGNSTDHYTGDWIDYDLIGVEDDDAFNAHYLKGAMAVGSESMMYQRGLAESIDPSKWPRLANRLLAARHVIHEKIEREGLQRVVTEFDPEVFNRNAAVVENILFGIPGSPDFRTSDIARHPHLKATLDEVGLFAQALEIGAELALRIATEDSRGHTGRRLMSHFDIADEEEASELVKKTAKGEVADPELRIRLLDLFLRYVPERHQFGLIDHRGEQKVLDARQVFYTGLPDDLKQQIVLFDKNFIHPRLSIHENLLFGRVVTREPAAEKRLDQLVDQTLEEMSLKRAVMLQMTQSQVGINGQRLPSTARHGIAISRMLIKRPEVMIFHDAMSPFSESERTAVRKNIREILPGSTMIWIARDVSSKSEFDTVFRLTDSGSVVELHQPSIAKGDATSGDALALIGRSPICGRLSAGHQQRIANSSVRVTAEQGDFVYYSGDTAHHAYILIEGEARSYRDPEDLESVASVLGAGETFGLMELLSDRDSILSVRAETPLTLLQLSGETIHDIVENDVHALKLMLRALTEQWAGSGRGRSIY